MEEKTLKLEDLGLPKDGQALYESLIALQQELKSQQAIPKKQLNQEMVDHLLKDGEPLITKILPRIKKELFQETIRQICLLYLQHVPARKDEINEILNLRSKLYPGVDLESFLHKHQKISSNLLTLVLENAYRPYFLALAERLQKHTNLENWKKNYCPVCGKKAALATIDEEDKQRILWCSFCSTGWPYLRLACPDCGNRDHEELQYIFLEDDRSFQILTCKKCKSYMKAVRSGLVKPENLPLVDAQTAALDLLAEREGYGKEVSGLH